MKKLSLAIVGMLLVSSRVWAQGCSMCSATVESNDESMIGDGLNSGILYLMPIPYILIGIVVFIWYRSYKKRQAEQQQS